MTDYLIESASLIGGRNENQDCYRSEETASGLLAVVCDGMGGVNGGRIAAELAVKVIFDQFALPQGMDPREALENAISKANEAVFTEGSETPGLLGMGTTVTALLVNDHYALAAHVGDSRIYQLRQGKKIFRTFDHSVVFEWVSSGVLTEEEARLSPYSNIISRVLGTHPRTEADISDKLPYKKGDRFLLCSDGIWGALPEPELIQRISNDKSVRAVLIDLVTFIDRLGFAEGGRHDNMTGILIEMQENSI